MILFKICWGINSVAAIIILYFFVEGLADDTIGKSNAGLWFFIIGALTGILTGSIWLRSHGHAKLALALLLVLVIPVLLFAFYFGIAVLSNERWN